MPEAVIIALMTVVSLVIWEEDVLEPVFPSLIGMRLLSCQLVSLVIGEGDVLEPVVFVVVGQEGVPSVDLVRNLECIKDASDSAACPETCMALVKAAVSFVLAFLELVRKLTNYYTLKLGVLTANGIFVVLRPADIAEDCAANLSLSLSLSLGFLLNDNFSTKKRANHIHVHTICTGSVIDRRKI